MLNIADVHFLYLMYSLNLLIYYRGASHILSYGCIRVES